jgi:hypothetical protein
MPKRVPLPTYERLHELLSYDPETGVLTAKVGKKTKNRRGTYEAGTVMGTPDAYGYLKVTVDDFPYLAHRLIWKMVTNTEPPEHIDHENRTRDDNRWKNLRECTPTQNAANKSLARMNKSGKRGVGLNPVTGRWMATATIEGVVRPLGEFATRDEAAEAYRALMVEHYGEFFFEPEGKQRVFYEFVHLADEPMLDAVADACRKLWAFRLGSLPESVLARLDAIALDLSTLLVKASPEKYGKMRSKLADA